MNSSAMVLACPLCMSHFSHMRSAESRTTAIYGYGLDFRVVPKDCNRSSDVAVCPECRLVFRLQDTNRRVPGQIKELVRSPEYLRIFERNKTESPSAKSLVALASILEVRGLNPRDLAVFNLRSSWIAREVGSLPIEAELLDNADFHFDDALRRGLTKGDPGMIMYLLGEINRRKGRFSRAREMLVFLGNNPRYRYPALLLTVLIEEEDSTPYWSQHAPDRMEQHSPKFRGLFPALRSIPPKKVEFSPDELSEGSQKSDEDDRRGF